ncbi:hypothetical protein CH373_05620 [Leptospira perolatii]|uniref:DUF5683 domain-containing protein n=1 Tax=Leptospira perolatii TaxID=2023191 RepID=A0A2M9ZQY2_9LEPT|nr:hypothetical protein [Leptospira perolatii]PJZ70545.1 hypothetical protein CH360_06040 [Leptospira perolatii]PJZ74381.1 hypothetical protein CH373_05620 [Leptospira perolatii]
MWTDRRFLPSIYLLAILFCSIFSFPLSAKEDGIKLEWKPIAEAGGYLVEVKDSSGRIRREKTNSTSILLDLPAGNYEHRIGVLNRYGRVSVFSSWIPFHVIFARPPEITSQTQNKFLTKDLPESIEIKGKYLSDVTKVVLKDRNGKEIPLKSVEFREPDILIITMDPSNPPEGLVSLKLENPKNKVTELGEFLVVAETPEKLAEYLKKPEPSPPFPWPALARSAVLPGWGQAYQGKSNTRSFAFPTLLIVAGVYTATRADAYTKSLSELDSARQTNLLLSTNAVQSGNTALFPLAIANYAGIPGKYSKAVGEYQNLQVSLGILGIIYLANLLDVSFFPGPQSVKIEGTNTDVTWNPLVRSSYSGGVPTPGRGFASADSKILPAGWELGVQFSW